MHISEMKSTWNQEFMFSICTFPLVFCWNVFFNFGSIQHYAIEPLLKAYKKIMLYVVYSFQHVSTHVQRCKPVTCSLFVAGGSCRPQRSAYRMAWRAAASLEAIGQGAKPRGGGKIPKKTIHCLKKVQILGGGNSNMFYFHPQTLGKCSNLTNIFQMGWNHQLVVWRRYR